MFAFQCLQFVCHSLLAQRNSHPLTFGTVPKHDKVSIDVIPNFTNLQKIRTLFYKRSLPLKSQAFKFKNPSKLFSIMFDFVTQFSRF